MFKIFSIVQSDSAQNVRSEFKKNMAYFYVLDGFKL